MSSGPMGLQLRSENIKQDANFICVCGVLYVPEAQFLDSFLFLFGYALCL